MKHDPVWFPWPTEPIEGPPESYLREIGTVFAVFDERTQDSGNISWGVEILGRRAFVKSAGRPDVDRPTSHQERCRILKNGVDVVCSVDRSVHRRPTDDSPARDRVVLSSHDGEAPPTGDRVVPSIPEGEVPTTRDRTLLPRYLGQFDSSWGPVVVFEWAEGELLYRRRPNHSHTTPHPIHVSADDGADTRYIGGTLRSPLERLQSLPRATVREFLNDVFRLHALLEAEGWISCDFYDGCLLYDFASHRCHVIDLDHYVRGPFVNSMGRMFGSSRFMAPEEFQLGARIDTRTSVFHLGRLGQIVLGSRARLEVFDRACRDAPADRWRTVAEFVEAWESTRAWEDTRTGGE